MSRKPSNKLRDQVLSALKNGKHTRTEITAATDFTEAGVRKALLRLIDSDEVVLVASIPQESGGNFQNFYGLPGQHVDVPERESSRQPPSGPRIRSKYRIPPHCDLMAAFYGMRSDVA